MTYIEVIIGITLLALVGTISFAKFNLSNYRVNSFIKQMTSDIRYVRQINKIGNERVYMVFTQQDNCRGYILVESGEKVKSVFLPENVELECPISKILFNSNGGFYMGGTTISIINKNSYTEVTIVPTSGRILIKEGIYK